MTKDKTNGFLLTPDINNLYASKKIYSFQLYCLNLYLSIETQIRFNFQTIFRQI